ncbi:MAG: hypothetical protein SNJ83_01820 [Aggregatilineales bacterium]
MDTFLRYTHSGLRWVVVAVLIAALLYMLYGWLAKRPWDRRGQILLSAFSGLVGLQWIVGLVFLVVWGSQTGFGIRHYWEHLFAQTLALAVAHLHYMWRRREMADVVRYRNNFLAVLGTFGLIFVGILALPETMRWRLSPGATTAAVEASTDEAQLTDEAQPEATPEG